MMTAIAPMTAAIIVGFRMSFRGIQPMQLEEPIRTVALVCVSFGLRISEALALKWSDVDWLNGTLRVERGIVRQRIRSVKTAESEQKVSAGPEMLQVMNSWRQTTTFASESDWIFASPAQICRQRAYLRRQPIKTVSYYGA